MEDYKKSKYYEEPENSDMAYDLASNIVYDLAFSKKEDAKVVKDATAALQAIRAVGDKYNLTPCKPYLFKLVRTLSEFGKSKKAQVDANCLEFFANRIVYG